MGCSLLAGALVLAACGGSGEQYVKNGEDHAYFRVPGEWKLYDEKHVIDNTDDLSEEQRDKILENTWRTAFDASPDPELRNLFSGSARYPTGFALVQPLSGQSQDEVSDLAMRNQFVPVDEALEGGQGDLLAYEMLNLDDGFHGIRFRARIHSDPESQIYSEGPAFTFEQISLLNQAKDKMYSMFVMCSSKCFEGHTDRITRVIDSWTVEES